GDGAVWVSPRETCGKSIYLISYRYFYKKNFSFFRNAPTTYEITQQPPRDGEVCRAKTSGEIAR
ncbi:hypothetical protein EB093_09370, partial [bacterium]|nr:hypothetical protein [bacterium]